MSCELGIGVSWLCGVIGRDEARSIGEAEAPGERNGDGICGLGLFGAMNGVCGDHTGNDEP